MSKKLYFPKQKESVKAEIDELKPILRKHKHSSTSGKKLEHLRSLIKEQMKRLPSQKIRTTEEEQFLAKLKEKYKPPSEKIRESEIAKKQKEEQEVEKQRLEQRQEDIRTALLNLPAELRALLPSTVPSGAASAISSTPGSPRAPALPVGSIASTIGLTGPTIFTPRLDKDGEILKTRLRSQLRVSNANNDLKSLFDNKLTENQNIQLLNSADKTQLDYLRKLPVMKPQLRDFLNELHALK